MWLKDVIDRAKATNRVKSLHGAAGKMSLSETGKGIWFKIQESEYVTPAERVRKLSAGNTGSSGVRTN